MKKFVFLFVGVWEDQSQDVMDAWTKWFESIGERIVDGGNPLGAGREITPDGVVQLESDLQAISGYSIINAEDMDDAVEVAKSCPIVTAVRVYEAMSM